MRNFLLILILTFSFQTLTKADDIRDFQIEGISIGDSLLDHFKENEINEAIDESAKDRLYILKTFKNKNFDKIDWGKYDMPTKEGHYFPITFDFKNLSRVMVSCQDWNKKSGIEDNLKVALFSAKYSEYLQQQNK